MSSIHCGRLSATLTLLVGLILMAAHAAQAAPLPHVVILATGGTIAGQGKRSDQTIAYTPGVVGVAALMSAVPEMNRIARLDGEQVFNIGSENMTQDRLLVLASRVKALLARDDVDGIVITHGTDTLEESAYFLNLTVDSDKPVVMTAAMRPATAISADGPLNLLSAVRVAADPNARGRGVMMVLNDRIGSARFTTKQNSTVPDTFGAREEGFIGQIVSDQVYFETRSDKRHTVQSEFAGALPATLPDVVIIPGYQDDPRYMFDAAIAHHAAGIIFAGSGAGSVSVRSAEGIREAERAGIIVVRATRTGSGIVPVDHDQPGLVSDSLNPWKARILLMLGLTRTHDPAQLQAMFHQY